ncbi:hypothetical protein [Terrisporobacter glycolicus]|uniref:Uncharacterized protein n=1 Tax=Terrisporobacter glycolicus ATCC 14880 = DSM 1288 TaxID=1121315 RepID=A0ABZ2ES11_9FIRM|nr:hypothetical protein [Terrisporobacter glycolicus]
MEEILINMGSAETVQNIINNVDSGVYNIVDEEEREVSILVEKNNKLETRTMKGEGWILSMEYDKNGPIITESLIKIK